MEDKLLLSPKTMQLVVRQIGIIDSFKGYWKGIEKKENKYLKQLKHIATIESTGASTRIEGADLTDKEIEELLESVNIGNLKSRDEQEVVGYYDALETIFDNYNSIQLTENYIKQLHGILLKPSKKDEHHKGDYKTLHNKVVATYPGGAKRVIFNTTEPHLVEKEMNELVKWTNSALKNRSWHPLLVIGAFVYEFLSIHPFKDGNGRLSRLLTTLLLLKHDYFFIQYISFENIIEERKKDYYKALMAAQKHRYKKEEKIDQWALFFFDGLTTLTHKLEKKYEAYSKKGSYLNDRQKQVLSVIKKQAPVKLSDILMAIPGINRSTLKQDLNYLLNENNVTRLGNGKSTVYMIKE